MVTTSKKSKRTAPQAVGELPLLSLARQVRSWTDTLLGVAGIEASVGVLALGDLVLDDVGPKVLRAAGEVARALR